MCGFDGNVLTSVGRIAIKCGACSHLPIKMNCNNFSDLLMFPVMPSSSVFVLQN